MPGDRRSVRPRLQKLHRLVSQIDDLLLPEETAYLVSQGEAAGFERSETNSKDGISKGRTSQTAYLRNDDDVVQCLRRRLGKVAKVPADRLEDLQVVRYTPGQRYRPHNDALREYPDRAKTIFAYLQADGLENGDCGGSTSFTKLRGPGGKPLRVWPREGSALMWNNLVPSGHADERTEHAGEAVTCKGREKIGLNAWFREDDTTSV